jgi:general secretion pathway protein K
MLALEFSQRSRINLTMAVNYSDSKKALYYAYGGYQAALSLIKKDTNDFDGPGDFWYEMLPPIPIGEGIVAVDVRDEKARFNVRDMVTPRGTIDKRRTVMCERMFRALAIDPDLVYGIVDWQDKDDVVEQNGAELSYYSLLTPSYEPRNGQFVTSGEILLVKGFDRDLFFIPPSSRSPIANENFDALSNYITVYGDGKININTAPEPVLLSLSKDMDEYIVQDIIEFREKAVFENIEDLKKVKSVSDILYNEIRSLITVKSDLFRITARGVSGNFTQVITAVVLKESKGFRVVYYNRSL